MPAQIDENTQFVDSSGAPIVNGFIYIGDQNADPVLNPQAIFSDRALTVALANPQRTDSDGRSVNKIWITDRYSIKVEDVNNVQKLIDLDAGDLTSTGTTKLTNVQGTNTLTAEGVPAISALVDKQLYIFTVVTTNTGAVTLNIDSTGAKTVSGVVSGDFVSGEIVVLVYNSGTDTFQKIIAVPNTIPAGLIALFSGAISAIPTGWVICDGNNSTPDLTNKFVIHADADSGGTNDVGDTGGSVNTSSHTLTESEIPAHDHVMPFGDASNNAGSSTGSGQGLIDGTAASVNNAGGGGGHTHDNSLPPFYALAYIMKT